MELRDSLTTLICDHVCHLGYKQALAKDGRVELSKHYVGGFGKIAIFSVFRQSTMLIETYDTRFVAI